MTSPHRDPLIGKIIADRYQILEELGEGGMGRVYLAEHVRMGRKSAVKVMSPNLALSADAISRFNREAANASKINHPNVAQIYDFGETSDGMLYLAMEFVEGETLRGLLQREVRLPMARAAELTRQIAGALAAAHHLGIVHRDLKPDNIMIARQHDGADWVKVVDFGIAKTVQGSGDPGAGSQTVTTAGVSLGTPEYMSPEQLAGERLDNRTDLYSLGLVLFHMLTGDLPYPRVTSRETLVKRLTSAPHTLAEMAPGVAWPAALQIALDRALAPEAADRYDNVADFARDVSSAVSGTAGVIDASAATVRATTFSTPTRRLDPETGPTHAPVAAQPRRGVVFGVTVGLLGAAGLTAAFAMYQRYQRSEPSQHIPAASAPALASAATTPAVTQIPTTPAITPVPTPTATPTPAAPRSPAPIRRVVVPETVRVAVTETIPVKAPPSRPAVRQAGAAAAHNWLRANGDSGAPRELGPNATDADRIRYLVQEIRGHASRAGMLFDKGNYSGVRGELRDLGMEVQTFRVLYPAASDSMHLDQQIRGTGMRLVQRCRTALADSTRRFPPNFTCENLLPGGGRGRQNSAGRPGSFQPPTG